MQRVLPVVRSQLVLLAVDGEAGIRDAVCAAADHDAKVGICAILCT